MAKFQLKFPIEEVARWAAAYSYPAGDEEPIEIGKKAREQGYLTRPQFLAIARWKSARPSKYHQQNSAEMVEAVTRIAFSTPVEPLRLRSLTLLSGVQPRTASAILHMCHRDPYPMMDVRAFESLGIAHPPQNWVSIWSTYVAVCRDIAMKAGTDMRTLDRALWAYSASLGPAQTTPDAANALHRQPSVPE